MFALRRHFLVIKCFWNSWNLLIIRENWLGERKYVCWSLCVGILTLELAAGSLLLSAIAGSGMQRTNAKPEGSIKLNSLYNVCGCQGVGIHAVVFIWKILLFQIFIFIFIFFMWITRNLYLRQLYLQSSPNYSQLFCERGWGHCRYCICRGSETGRCFL